MYKRKLMFKIFYIILNIFISIFIGFFSINILMNNVLICISMLIGKMKKVNISINLNIISKSIFSFASIKIIVVKNDNANKENIAVTDIKKHLSVLFNIVVLYH